ncbi:endonuclease domain-containing protein [Nonomuraea soli]|uniref:DUF559 domain-containing protein n=1 Tax=Nonomuraea soli TaxID=1032476 RepID=A0A7W0CDZ5_9ACTN|nr:DUF559 domain-containing protein [Nonomuraea soli]MBA2889262.1 hypothetical protein [Nonomuraea soli]
MLNIGSGWNDLPVGRAVRVTGTRTDAPASSPLTPAVAVLSPRGRDLTSQALDEVESACLRLFPAWLPGAEGLSGSGGAAPAAARSLAHDLARRTSHFGPWLSDLAERAVTGSRGRRFPAETRAVGLSRVLAASYGRASAALLVRVPEGLDPADERAFVSGAHWLARSGRFGVWLTGAELREPIEGAEVPVDPPSRWHPDLPASCYPPVAGRPHPGSPAELRLEQALARHPWAAGREWNRTYQHTPLHPPIHPDLMWRADRCVVEADGPDHRGPDKFARDRRRDVDLQLDGFAVLRFTNQDVLTDVASVVARIERFLRTRREG